MPNSDWKYVDNQFDTTTRTSFKKMHTLGPDHDAKLAASPLPEVAPLRARFQPVLAAWRAAYNAWKNFAAAHRGATQALTNHMESLTRVVPEQGSTLERLENAIAVKYPRASANFRTIFPNGRAGLTEGTLDERVSALRRLADRAADAGGLPAALVTEIGDFATAAEDLRAEQQKQEGLEEAARLALEPRRVAMARMLYKNLGTLMDLHADNPEAITGYFDLSVLRSTGGAPEPDAPDAPDAPEPGGGGAAPGGGTTPGGGTPAP